MADTVKSQQPEKKERKIAGKIYVINEIYALQGATASELYKHYVRQAIKK